MDAQPVLGRIFAIVGLILVPFSTYFRRIPSSTLDLMQLSYIFASVLASNNRFFSNELGFSWLTFMPSFFKSCDPNHFACMHGNLVCPLIVWTAFAILTLIVLRLARKKIRYVRYQTFYNFYKGFLRWMIWPLFYFGV
jgi:hypothetical protein